jgi:hemerythrin-like domain-containing protein
MSGTKCIALLMNEHRTILRALYVLEAMGDRARKGEIPPETDVRSLLEFLQSFADDRHQGKEESVLFPIFLDVCDRAKLDVVGHMIFEHNQERSLAEGLEDALLTGNGPDFAYYADRLSRILSNHIHKEDRILFALIDQTLSPENDAKVCAGFDEMDKASIPRLDRVLSDLQTLERRYLGRTVSLSGGPDSVSATDASSASKRRKIL